MAAEGRREEKKNGGILWGEVNGDNDNDEDG